MKSLEMLIQFSIFPPSNIVCCWRFTYFLIFYLIIRASYYLLLLAEKHNNWLWSWCCCCWHNCLVLNLVFWLSRGISYEIVVRINTCCYGMNIFAWGLLLIQKVSRQYLYLSIIARIVSVCYDTTSVCLDTQYSCMIHLLQFNMFKSVPRNV